MTTGVTLHNMIVENERDTYDYNNNESLFFSWSIYCTSIVPPSFSCESECAEHVIRRREREIMSTSTRWKLQGDFIESLWHIHDEEQNSKMLQIYFLYIYDMINRYSYVRVAEGNRNGQRKQVSIYIHHASSLGTLETNSFVLYLRFIISIENVTIATSLKFIGLSHDALFILLFQVGRV